MRENGQETKEFLEFAPDRIGHGTCIHPSLGKFIIVDQKKFSVQISMSIREIGLEICFLLIDNSCCSAWSTYGNKLVFIKITRLTYNTTRQ